MATENTAVDSPARNDAGQRSRQLRQPSTMVRVIAVLSGLAAVAGVAAIWSGLTVMLGGPCGWMAVVAALDAALLLRLASFPAGRERAAFALVITAATVAAGAFLFATAHVGLMLGMRPSESVWKMSLGLASLYVQANTGWVELAWVGAALMIAWLSNR
jgi:hypothetical protein